MRHRHRPSPALVVACLALAVALSGTGYAAFKLPRGSVGTIHLKKGAVTSPKVRNGSLTLLDLAATERPKLKGDKGDLGATGPKGDKGDKGDPGPQGAPGLSEIQVVSKETSQNSGSPKGLTVMCPPGTRATGGGPRVSSAGSGTFTVEESWPVLGIEAGNPPIGWHVEAKEAAATNEVWRLRGTVVCAKVGS